jgi:hypothetical protein
VTRKIAGKLYYIYGLQKKQLKLKGGAQHNVCKTLRQQMFLLGRH